MQTIDAQFLDRTMQTEHRLLIGRIVAFCE